MTKISFIMPSFNSEKFLRQALLAVIECLDESDELVFQDGFSTDGTLGIVESMGDSRIKTQSVRDDGQADALNRALSRCTGDYVIWINSDDLINKNGFDSLRARISDRSKLDFVYGDYETVDATGMRLRYFLPGKLELKDLLFGGKRPFNGSLLVKRDFLIEVGGFNSSLHYCMDYELYLRLWSKSKNYDYAPTLVGALRLHDATKTSTKPWGFVREANRIRSRYQVSPSDFVKGLRALVLHSVTVASTPIRSTDAYRRLTKNLRKHH